VIKSKGKSKEGYSLFAMFDRTKSLPGRTTLRTWMLRPFCDKAQIMRRQSGVAMVMEPDHSDYIQQVG
jgi:DNA mismatch repair ATPase MutS